MYKNNLVMSINCGGKFLQETKEGEVFLPFLSEYSVFIKNKYTKKASVGVFIDGKDVLNGRRIVLNPQESFNLERFLDDDLDEGRKFRFIKKTEGIVAHRGNNPEDSLVEVRFKFESKPNIQYNDFTKITSDRTTPFPRFGQVDYLNFPHMELNCMDSGPKTLSNCVDGGPRSALRGLSEDAIGKAFGIEKDSSLVKGTNASIQDEKKSFQFLETEEGITVKGSKSEQKFRQTFHFQTEIEEHVMILKLRGTSKQEKEIVEAVTKTTKKVCTSCGKKWDYSFTYCPDDATFLEEE